MAHTEGEQVLLKSREYCNVITARICVLVQKLAVLKLQTLFNLQHVLNHESKASNVKPSASDNHWSWITADQLKLYGQEYLVVVDFYSGFNAVKQLQERSCSFNLITFFKELFYKYGVPGTLVTNKGQQFTSHDSYVSGTFAILVTSSKGKRQIGILWQSCHFVNQEKVQGQERSLAKSL